MTRKECIKWLKSLKTEIGKPEHQALWHYAEAVDTAIEALTQDSRNVTQESDLIKRSDAVLILSSEMYAEGHGTNLDDCVQEAKAWMAAAPSADRPTGEWVYRESNHVERIYLCSNCRNYEAWGETEKTPYCPNCGARMMGGDEYERCVEQMEHDIIYEPTYNQEDGSM